MPKDKSSRIEKARTARRIHMCLAMLQEGVQLLRNSGAMQPWGNAQADKVLRWTDDAMREAGSCWSSAYWREFHASMEQVIAVRDRTLNPTDPAAPLTSLQGVSYILAAATLMWECRAVYARTGRVWRYLDMTATTFLSVLLGSIASAGFDEYEDLGHAVYLAVQPIIFNDQPATGIRLAAAA